MIHELARGCWTTCTCGFTDADWLTLLAHMERENSTLVKALTDSAERSTVKA